MRKVHYTIERDPTINWILGPVGACVDYLAVEMAMAGVMVRGVQLMPLVPLLMEVAAGEFERHLGAQSTAPIKAFLDQDMAFEGMAEKLAENDFALANSHTLVSLWAGIESCVEDTVVLALINDEKTVDAVRREVRLRGHSSGLLEEPEARRAFRALERTARQTNSVLETYDWCLSLLEVYRIPGSDLSDSLTEINALRNSIMHNTGIADERTVRSAPTLNLKPGDQIRLSRDELRSYYDSMSSFVQEVLKGVIKSRHVRSKDELEAHDV